MVTLNRICSALLALTGLLMLHKSFYLLLGLLPARRWPETKRRFRYAVVIAARNEERVIGSLIASIRAQSYGPVEIFVVADNCTDGTAALCRSLGAVVYERFEPERARKGYALSFLFRQIARDYGIGHVDGYFVFDADNLLHPDFIREMNKAFAAGAQVVTGYRSTKNFDSGAIAAGYGIHFYSATLREHRPRARLGLGTHLTGTGYLIASSLLAEGWNCTSLTEDAELTLRLAGRGKKVAFCEAAEFFDEQPLDLPTAMRQRIRWAKGRLANFFCIGHLPLRLLLHGGGFTGYDLFTHYLPFGLLNWLLATVYPLCAFVAALLSPEGCDLAGLARNLLVLLGSQYFGTLAGSVLTVLRERRHIHCGRLRLLLYTLLSPWFTLLSIPVYLTALCMRVRWKPIAHTDTRPVETLLNGPQVGGKTVANAPRS